MVTLDTKFFCEGPGEEVISFTEVSLDSTLFEDGVIAKLSGNQLKVLLSIYSYGEITITNKPTNKQIAARSGLSITTTSKIIHELLNLELDGNPILCL